MGISRFGSYCAFAVCEFYKRAERHGGSHQALDYAGCVLNNWERIDPLGPVSPQRPDAQRAGDFRNIGQGFFELWVMYQEKVYLWPVDP